MRGTINRSFAVLISGIILALCLFFVTRSQANSPAPVSYGSAVVDGSPSEWNLQGPVPMYTGGNPDKPQISEAYLRYSCSTETLYVLVLGPENPPLLKSPGDAWASLGGSPQKEFTGSSGNDGTPPDFAWIERSPDPEGYDTVQGYEASFYLSPGSYEDFVVHAEFLTIDGTGGTSANVGFRDVFGTTPLLLDCSKAVGSIQIDKFYDRNADGLRDIGEPSLPGWQVSLNGELYKTPAKINDLEAGNYLAEERQANETNWINTNPTSAKYELGSGESWLQEFGNVCLGSAGGKTLGFWSNKNGAVLVDSFDLAYLRVLHLRNSNGNDFDPASYSPLRSWLLSATGENMAYMLSAQLAATELSLREGFVQGNSLVYAPGASGANSAGFLSINELTLEADAELAIHGNTRTAGATRSYQETLKNALDRANNNLNFVQTEPCSYSFLD